MRVLFFLLLGLSGVLLSNVGCGTMPQACMSGSCADAGLVINELAGSGGDFVELFNASDKAADLSGFGLTDVQDGGVRFATALRFGNGISVPARSYFTIFLEVDCPTTVSPCVRGEFGISQASGDTVVLLDQSNAIVGQQAYPANAAASGSSWARTYDGAAGFEAQRRSPGAKNAP